MASSTISKDYIEQLRSDIQNKIQIEYGLQNYKPEYDLLEQTNPITDKFVDKNDREVNFEVLKLNNQMNKMQKQREFKTARNADDKTAKQDSSTTGSKPANIANDSYGTLELKDDMYNIIDDDRKYVEWKQLSVEDKKKQVDEYITITENMNGIKVGNDIINTIYTAVDNNKILYKKDILYDKINGKIGALYGLRLLGDKYEFGIVPVIIKRKNFVSSILKK
jgi:hypothetical protein